MLTHEAQNLNKENDNSDNKLTYLLLSPLIQRCIYIAAELGISDFLAIENLSIEEISLKTNTHSPSLYRMMRLLVNVGLYYETEDHKFALKPMGDLLRIDSKKSMRNYALFMGSEWIWNVWGHGKYSIESGNTSQQEIYGKGIFEFLNENENLKGIFNRGMTSGTLRSVEQIINSYKFSNQKTIVDVGGGNGILLAKILKTSPELKGVLYDQYSVIEKSEITFLEEGVNDQVKLIGGNFFNSVPHGGDLYILKYILHDWDDESAVVILKNIASVLNRNSRLIIIETILSKDNESNIAILRDMIMLFLVGGKERTKDEYEILINKSGLQLTNVFSTNSPISIIEVKVK